MTVNYTTNLALGQPVTGTESGTWGDDVNNSVTSYLDIAISGSLILTSASFTANALTLVNTLGNSSATNIAVNTAQYYVLRVSSLAANVTITAPSLSKTYLVVNADATYSATIKAAGQTGISIAPGERATVYFSGTDYIKVTSSVVSNLTGVLPVANGGTGVTTSTGTGNVVLSTSPTLVTPALGTPSALVGTNITGTATAFTASNVTTNANLTGAITSSGNATSLGSFTSAQLATALTDETGTGANVFATSPTLVTPILGTPTSVALTNATGLPLTTGVTGTLSIANGGTGLTTTPANGALDIGNGTGFTRATLTAGSNVTITNSAGGISIASTNSGGTVTSVTGTAPVVSSGGNTPAISMAAATTSVDGYLTSTDWTTFNGKVTVGGALGTPSSGTLTNCTFPTLNQNTTGSAATLTTTVNSSVVGTTQSFGTSNTTIATTAFVQAALAALHPVGSIYTATVATNPATLLGFGTWTTFGSGRMLISQDATYTAGSTGGFATTTLITANLPVHNHTFTGNALPSHDHAYTTPLGGYTLSGSGGTGSNAGTTGGASGGTPTGTIGNTGSGTAVTTISPYIAVYMWQRTA